MSVRLFSLWPSILTLLWITWSSFGELKGQSLSRLRYNNPGLTVDLGVGLGSWPLPMDYRSDAYDQKGQWLAGPLRGYVYIALNSGTDESPSYSVPEKLRTADGNILEVFGWPSPVFADFSGNGRLGLICGEFLDESTRIAQACFIAGFIQCLFPKKHE